MLCPSFFSLPFGIHLPFIRSIKGFRLRCLGVLPSGHVSAAFSSLRAAHCPSTLCTRQDLEPQWPGDSQLVKLVYGPGSALGQPFSAPSRAMFHTQYHQRCAPPPPPSPPCLSVPLPSLLPLPSSFPPSPPASLSLHPYTTVPPPPPLSLLSSLPLLPPSPSLKYGTVSPSAAHMPPFPRDPRDYSYPLHYPSSPLLPSPSCLVSSPSLLSCPFTPTPIPKSPLSYVPLSLSHPCLIPLCPPPPPPSRFPSPYLPLLPPPSAPTVLVRVPLPPFPIPQLPALLRTAVLPSCERVITAHFPSPLSSPAHFVHPVTTRSLLLTISSLREKTITTAISDW